MSLTVRSLRRRAERAGAVGADGFADWLILDVRWFGSPREMDRADYERWRTHALQIYQADPDEAVVRVREQPLPRPPEPRQAAADQDARFAVRAALVMVAIFVLIAVMAAASSLGVPQPPERQHQPAMPVAVGRT